MPTWHPYPHKGIGGLDTMWTSAGEGERRVSSYVDVRDMVICPNLTSWAPLLMPITVGPVHGSSSGCMPFLPSPVVHMCASGS